MTLNGFLESTLSERTNSHELPCSFHSNTGYTHTIAANTLGYIIFQNTLLHWQSSSHKGCTRQGRPVFKVAQDVPKFPSGSVWSLIKCTAWLPQKLPSYLKMSLFFHLGFSPQSSPSQIIAHLYKPNFWPFQISIHPADGEPHSTQLSDPLEFSGVSWQQFFDPLRSSFTCQVSRLNMCLTSQRTWYEFFAPDNGQSSPLPRCSLQHALLQLERQSNLMAWRCGQRLDCELLLRPIPSWRVTKEAIRLISHHMSRGSFSIPEAQVGKDKQQPTFLICRWKT